MTPEAAKAEGPEPTMEEILASIRRIISEDGAKVEAAPPPPDTVLDLTEMLEAEKPAAAAPPPPPPLPPAAAAPPPSPPPPPDVPVPPEVVMEDTVPEPAKAAAPPPPMPVAEIPEKPVPSSDDDVLLSATAAKATAAAMSALASPRGGYAEGLSIGNGARTLESIVLELIRPVLKEWLDRNLPPMVERIVQKEIRKITRDLG